MSLLQANALRIPLADNSVHCCITSPPYWMLRSYLSDDNPLKQSEIGLEQTVDEYVANIVAVFREVRRVLRADGTCWIVIGDSYFGGGRGEGSNGSKQQTNKGSLIRPGDYLSTRNIKPKDLCGIPWRVALALQQDGWWLRSEITWCKKAPMPESVTDRPTSATEKVFLLAKSARYYYDNEAIKEPSVSDHASGNGYKRDCRLSYTDSNGARGNDEPWQPTTNRNKRNYWVLGPEPYPNAHFATYPTALVEPCILAGTSAYGVCSCCGAPWKRVVEKESRSLPVSERNGRQSHCGQPPQQSGWYWTPSVVREIGWQPTCTCNAGEPIPATVLDPFIGSGTTGVVAINTGRQFIGIDLSMEYLKLAQNRVAGANKPLISVGL